MTEPTHGYTAEGTPVHGSTIDHHPDHSSYARLNKWMATRITERVGTMTCAYLFAVLALTSLPAVLVAADVVHFGSVLASAGFILVVSWVAQSFLQLVLLPTIMVGQNVQSAASDARAAKTFEDVEHVREDLTQALDRLDTSTQGGLREVLEAIEHLGGKAAP